jgi:hypothetical protein
MENLFRKTVALLGIAVLGVGTMGFIIAVTGVPPVVSAMLVIAIVVYAFQASSSY